MTICAVVPRMQSSIFPGSNGLAASTSPPGLTSASEIALRTIRKVQANEATHEQYNRQAKRFPVPFMLWGTSGVGSKSPSRWRAG